MEIQRISRGRFTHTVVWAVVTSGLVVAIAAGLARATLNIDAALIDKPHIAIYMLLPDEEISHIETLRETEEQHDYLATTKDGMKLVQLRRSEETGEWYVHFMEQLHN
ncbi:MAG: hypothetical protein O2904_05010 [bacterium]|nr:hypothetical protein [bacterium]